MNARLAIVALASLAGAVPLAAQIGPDFDPAGWDYGPRYSADGSVEVWNPVMQKMLAGEPVIGLEYIGADGQYISIFQSLAPAQTIHDWASEVGYSGNDIRLVNNKPTFLADLSDDSGRFSSASFIHQDLFVVIDGTVDGFEMQQIVAGLLANNQTACHFPPPMLESNQRILGLELLYADLSG